MSNKPDWTDRVDELEYAIRADERERLANEFIERGDIGTGPGEMSIVAWLLKSEGGETRRRFTREDYLEGLVDNRGLRTAEKCKYYWVGRWGQKMYCHESATNPMHDVHNPTIFAHKFQPFTTI